MPFFVLASAVIIFEEIKHQATIFIFANDKRINKYLSWNLRKQKEPKEGMFAASAACRLLNFNR
ncbi:MAG TPA: hypothetical protein VEM15_09790 [Thermodesulfobacteriota bacterium]|nr:hypothetical protein [Thermodesulfobacteriota bacterium]